MATDCALSEILICKMLPGISKHLTGVGNEQITTWKETYCTDEQNLKFHGHTHIAMNFWGFVCLFVLV